MIPPARSTIAQLLYPQDQAFDFARIVAELEAVLMRVPGDPAKAGQIQITWDCDDLVTFDMDDTRILLSCVEFGRGGHATCLTVSVGPADLFSRTASHHAVLCSRLVERIQFRFVPAAILWQEVEGPVNADVADELIDCLPSLKAVLPPVETILDHVLRRDRSKAEPSPLRAMLGAPARAAQRVEPPAQIPRASGTDWHLPGPAALGRLGTLPGRRLKAAAQPTANPAATPSEPPTDRPFAAAVAALAEVAANPPRLPRERDDDLCMLRDAFYPPPSAGEQTPSTQMRLAAHCLNASLILVWAPLGAAVMTYSLLKGEDMRLSSRMIAVVGTLLAVNNSPFGHSVRALAGVIANSPLGHSVRALTGV